MIKRSSALQKMMDELADIDFYWVDSILNDADYYTIEDKTMPEESLENGIKLYIKAQKKNKPIYAVEYMSSYNFCSAYFIGDLDEVKEIFRKHIQLANKGSKAS